MLLNSFTSRVWVCGPQLYRQFTTQGVKVSFSFDGFRWIWYIIVYLDFVFFADERIDTNGQVFVSCDLSFNFATYLVADK